MLPAKLEAVHIENDTHIATKSSLSKQRLLSYLLISAPFAPPVYGHSHAHHAQHQESGNNDASDQLHVPIVTNYLWKVIN